MATALNIKRKNIDIPIDTLQKLSTMAAAQGKSLKASIESVLISKANSTTIEISENPSPSGDKRFEADENLSEARKGIAHANEGKKRTFSMDGIRDARGI